MSADPGAPARARAGYVAALYAAVVAGLTVLWSLNQIGDQLRMQPAGGQCGGVLVSAEGGSQGEAERCELVYWRAAVLIVTGFALVSPVFLPAAVLVFPSRRTRKQTVGRFRVLLFVLLTPSVIWPAFGIGTGIENNAQGEYCRYVDAGFAPWSVQGFPCWPDFGYLALHWALFAGAIFLILAVPLGVIAGGRRLWRECR